MVDIEPPISLHAISVALETSTLRKTYPEASWDIVSISFDTETTGRTDGIGCWQPTGLAFCTVRLFRDSRFVFGPHTLVDVEAIGSAVGWAGHDRVARQLI
jgi:hypothetical protein